MKKYTNFFTEIVCIFFDIFVLNDTTKSFKINKKDLIEKVQRISKSNFTHINKKNKINDVTIHLNKMFENLSNLLKNYSKLTFFS